MATPRPPYTLSYLEALTALEHGHKITRRAWNSDLIFVQRLDPLQDSLIVKSMGHGKFQEWEATKEDMFASDWDVVVNFMENY